MLVEPPAGANAGFVADTAEALHGTRTRSVAAAEQARTRSSRAAIPVLKPRSRTIGAAEFFGSRSFQKETVSYKTFFDESVQGLEIGSPVKFRGVVPKENVRR